MMTPAFGPQPLLDLFTRHPHLFVTGTDTAIGKTTTTTAIIRTLRASGVNAVGLKPLVSGVEEDGTWGDTEAIFAANAGLLPRAVVSPVRLQAPKTPKLAARDEGIAIDLAAVSAQALETLAGFEAGLIEGVGGLLAPLDAAGRSNADWIARLDLPALVVTTPRLGTINHTALTVEVMRMRGLTLAGLVLNRWSGSPDDHEMLEELEHIAPVVWGIEEF
ncbi:MAG: dethiobiotin synthase [Proteobacteria bacterium CG1_02_64_396]|nr:MAG: dethiobiotin synthase [Proteobacteria bacterium CG1_02_64_396]